MDRRTFTKSLAAVMAFPTAPAPIFAAKSSVVAVPSQARYWAIYMNSLHGQCTPRALQVMLNIPQVQAEGVLNQLVSEGVIKPNHLLNGLKKVVSPKAKPKVIQDMEDRIKEEIQELSNTKDDTVDCDQDAPIPILDDKDTA